MAQASGMVNVVVTEQIQNSKSLFTSSVTYYTIECTRDGDSFSCTLNARYSKLYTMHVNLKESFESAHKDEQDKNYPTFPPRVMSYNRKERLQQYFETVFNDESIISMNNFASIVGLKDQQHSQLVNPTNQSKPESTTPASNQQVRTSTITAHNVNDESDVAIAGKNMATKPANNSDDQLFESILGPTLVTYIVKTPQKEQIINIPKKNRTDVNVEMLKRLTIKQLNLNCNDNHISLFDCIAKKEITDHNVDSLIQNSRLLFSIDKDKQYFNSLPNTTFDIRSGNSKEICKQFKKSILDPVIEAKNECKESQLTINVHDETSVEHLNHFLEFLVVRGTRHLLLSKKASKDGFSADASDGLNFHLKNRIEKLALILHAAITNIYTIVCLINYLTILGRKIKVIEIKDNDGGYSKLCEQPLKLQCASMSGLIQQAGETRVSLSKAYYSKLLAQAADDDCRLQAQEIRNVIEKRYDFDFTKIDDMKNNLNLDDNAENEAVQTQNVTMINENGNVREKIDKFRTHTTTTIASFFLEKNLRHRLLKLNDIVNYPQTSAAIVVKYSSRKEQDFKNNDSVIDTFGITHREFIEQMKKQVSVVECISLVDKYCIKNMNKQEGKIPGEFLPIVYCRESSGCIGASVDCLNSIENCIRSNADYFDLVIRAAAEGHCQALYALCFFDQLTKDFIYGNGQCTREVINSITRQKMCETIDHFINGNFLCVAYYTSNKTDVLDIMNVQADVSLIANSNLIALNSDEVKINSTMFESVRKFHRTESWLHEELHVKPRFFVDPMYESDTNNNENASAGIELAWGSEPTDENLRKITPNGYTTTSLNAKSVLAKFIYQYNDIGIRALTSYSRAGFELLELNKTPTVAVSNKSFANIVKKIVVEEKGTTKQLEWRHCTAPSESNDQLALMPCFL